MTAIAVVVVFEVLEHVVIPLFGLRVGHGRQPLTGLEGMIGKLVEVKRWSEREGTVSVGGELWKAESRARLAPGDTATIVAVSNLTLSVEPFARSIDTGDPPIPRHT